ncbi:alpha/beta fold hydrolase [Nannocystis bainbridge]|uniref:Alpha/beta fold hydrolase n=1 Tax=Nannocystis bainbridge TaxID=2995303 RepID=A0ABT5E618_9BACT|nr:alpha/beta fold hydrolase [Nannocystis bainbridge]MDC0720378.1 alpha/beta fold hydrolase [Nannocystis bainbridge]
MFARNHDTRIYYELGGRADGPPLLLLRGLTRTIRHWGPLLDDLGASFRTIAIDNRGVGHSDKPFGIYSTRTMADDAVAVLDHAGIGEAAVFGISLGGAIAQQLVLHHPQRVRRLVLGCTRASGKDGPPARLSTVLSLLSLLWLPEARALERSTPLVLSPAFLREHPEIVGEWQQLAEQFPTRRRALIGQLGAVLRHDTRARLGTIAVPTLVVSGDDDRLIDVACSHALAAAIPGARLELLPGAGHDIPAERPREVAALLREFCL